MQDISISSLIRRVDDFQRATEIETLERLDTENTLLRDLISAYRRNCHSTGVKGVINDARHYETTRRNKWTNVIRNSIFGIHGVYTNSYIGSRRLGGSSRAEKTVVGSISNVIDASFLEWCDSRRRSLESQANRTTCTKRSRPSARFYGCLDEVDAIGYLDAIERVSKDTIIIVLIYNHADKTSATVNSALLPIVEKNTDIRFVKIHYETMEVGQAATPAILAYKNQGDLFANLTGLAELISDNTFNSDVLEQLPEKHGIPSRLS
ncbi:hypothetical protein B0I35DRAFT_471919 [Stachybotrys elegans]|uniref:Phosducin domain-containing protein n=1 Tax=Stachybotrys elegans TaxID=80388 RepID=A0A8K0WJT0_9HYPO|nr:hypothetical protein B0I35DRAFT_471919 [Stachybotrys elegans]